jgi:hypothetical protein
MRWVEMMAQGLRMLVWVGRARNDGELITTMMKKRKAM